MGDRATSSKSSGLSLEGEDFVLTSSEIVDALGLECGVCHKSFDLAANLPKPLPCNHTFCLPCLKKFPTERTESSFNRPSSTVVKCPECRAAMPAEYRDSLPNDHRVIRGLDAIAQAKEKCRNICLKHGCNLLEYICTECQLPVCVDCSQEHQRSNPDHNIVSLKIELEKRDGYFNELEEETATYLRKLTARAGALSNISANLNATGEVEENKIVQSFEEYVNLLNIRKKALVKELEEKINKRKFEIHGENERVRKCARLLKASSDDFRKARECKDFRNIFTAEDDLIQQVDECKAIDSTSENDLCERYEFEPGKEEVVFITRLPQIGEVRTKSDLTMQRQPAA